jgi:hypothetical protein
MELVRRSAHVGEVASRWGTDVASILEAVDDFRRQRRGQLRLSMGRRFPGQRSVRVRHYFYGRSSCCGTKEEQRLLWTWPCRSRRAPDRTMTPPSCSARSTRPSPSIRVPAQRRVCQGHLVHLSTVYNNTILAALCLSPCRLAIHFPPCRPTSRETATLRPTATRMVSCTMYPPSRPQIPQRPCRNMWRMSCTQTSVVSHDETLDLRLTSVDWNKHLVDTSQAEHCIFSRTPYLTTLCC